MGEALESARSSERTSAAEPPPAGSTSEPAPPPARTPAPLPPIERIIPWRYRINTSFLGITVGLALAGVVLFAVAESRMQEQFLATQASGAALFSDTIEQATLRAMLEDSRSDAYETMRDIGRGEGVEAVRLLTKEGKVVFSTAEAEVGTVLDKGAASCKPCHANGTPAAHAPLLARTRVFERNGYRVLGLITPIRNARRCYTAECHVHKPSEDVLGLLDVDLSLRNADERIAAFRRGSIILTGAGVLAIAAFFMLFTRRNIVRPVQALVDATRRVAVDELDTEIRVQSKGELGLLAASFNDMIGSLRRTEDALHQLMEGLEHQVQERTADLRKAQAVLVQTEKLSSLGRLSASIAHEINNPLAGILTFAKLVIRTLEAGPPDEATRKDLVRNLALVQRETERCSAIVRNLLDFARDRPVALRELNVNAPVDEALQLIAHQIAIQGLNLEKRLAPTPQVMGDFGQLRQAIVNVAMNAVEAMGRSGTLTVVTRATEEGGAEIVISDTGPGISPDHLPRMFEPFFTTKEKGTGLGLSVVYGIVKQHKGQVEVHSEPGRGAKFTITLPGIPRPAPTPEEPEQKP
jgi:two-component system, NtrC family, sensor kinase